jgi:hypothetical protein
MTDTDSPDDRSPHAAGPARRPSVLIGLGIGGGILFVAIAIVVLMVALNVLGSTGFPTGAAQRVLLNASDLAKIPGVEIATDNNAEVHKHTLQDYVRQNPGDTSNTVSPAKCADNLEGWMAWKSLDTPAYRGWKTDVIYETSDIVIDSASHYQNGLQEARHFATVDAATAFMKAQRQWYRECANSTYNDPDDATNSASYAFSPIPLNLGLDSVVEGSTNSGNGVPPHLIDVYLRNKNIVYVTELVTNSAPQHGLDRVSLSIVQAAAKKLSTLR